MTFEFTAHAVERFIERVRPTLSRRQALAELRRLATVGHVVERPPEWVPSDHGRPACLMLGDDVCLPLERRRSGALVALTCLARESRPQDVLYRRRGKKIARAQRRWRAEHGPGMEAA